ncbi:hypothetical protein AX016_2883 [Cellulophaga sp. RHA19]|uniref:hypothetical protein n=1 Tax=Cellulophaga sp. RHA19 TaxID=1798237 RepID=UPI000C2C2DCE|nr:hypothetical protein [Cellulophaga sp. RHA19]PKB44662.1 hypothetical protein AX016_2883 [Cellulophaga sp. RHA19]
MDSKAGIGSFFHSTDANAIANFNTQDYITEYELFYTGRHAIKYIFDKLISEETIEKIWLPKYYCQHVTSWLQNCYSNIFFYTIDPFNEAHNLNVLDFATEKDIVLLNNFWGFFSYNIPTSSKKPFCIEDHSHGWLSTGCLTSKADYCVASLRKTLPIPLGGILWKPNNGKIKNSSIKALSDTAFYDNWDLVHKAMHLKKEYIANTAESNIKDTFLKLIGASETYLQHQYDVVALKEEHKIYMESYLYKDYTFYKKENLKSLLQLINNNGNFIILTNTINTPFGLHLAFKDRAAFTSLKAFLISKDIYPSELWPGNEKTDSWSYLLNIHIDYRYTNKDMAYIATSINQWGNSNTTN